MGKKEDIYREMAEAFNSLMPLKNPITLTPEEKAILEEDFHREAVSRCGDFILGGDLNSEEHQKCFAQNEFYAKMAQQLRISDPSDPESYQSFLAHPSEYAKEHWKELFEVEWEKAKKAIRF